MPTVIWKGSSQLEEAASSPQWKFGEKISVTRTFFGPYSLCLSSAPLRGAFGTGIATGLRVAESSVKRQKGGVGMLEVQYETGGGQPTQGATLPRDEVSIKPEKLERALAKHPRYSSLTATELQVAKNILETVDISAQQDMEAQYASNALLMDYLAKRQKGISHYVIYGVVYTLTLHFWNAPTDLTLGGFLEAPPTTPAGGPSDTIWLREGDNLSFNGTTWMVEKKWVGAPDWDTDLYPTL